MVPKGLLTFLGSLYKEVAKTTSGTLAYCFERQTARKKYFILRKTLCPRLGMCEFISGTLRELHFVFLMYYFMESKPKRTSVDSWSRVNAVIIETAEALETQYSIVLSGSNVIF